MPEKVPANRLTAICPHCHNRFSYNRWHAGFGDQGYMYCDTDEAVVTWSVYDSKYWSIVQKVPWNLNETEKKMVEGALRPCPFGGRFRFVNPPRCPICRCDIASVVAGGIYFVVTGRQIDGDSEEIWL